MAPVVMVVVPIATAAASATILLRIEVSSCRPHGAAHSACRVSACGRFVSRITKCTPALAIATSYESEEILTDLLRSIGHSLKFYFGAAPNFWIRAYRVASSR